MTAEPIRAAAYIRVSTEEQTEFSPDAQLREIKRFCAAKKAILSDRHIYRDDGVSAKRAETRPEFMRMIADAKKRPKQFDVIFVHRFDRFARNREDSVVYKSLLRKQCGIKVVSVTEPLEDDKFSIILESILEAMAEYYSLNLSDEVLKGMTEKALRGQLQTPAPLGYIMTDGVLEPCEKEADIVREIFNLYVYENMGSSEIAHILNEGGRLTKKGNKFKKRSVDYILKNPVYSGKLRWNPRRKSGGDGPIIADGAHEPIIEGRTYLLACEKKSAERKRERKPQGSHVLCGILKCARCGGNMYLCGNIFRCGNYLNGKCAYPQGAAVSKIEGLIASDCEKNGISPDAMGFIYVDKDAGSGKVILRRDVSVTARLP